MNRLNTFRNPSAPRTRIVLAALALGWLNLVLQPCVLAAPHSNLSDGGTAGQTIHDGHLVHDESNIAQHDQRCSHCGESDCFAVAGCEDLGATKSDMQIKSAKPGTEPGAAFRSTTVCDLDEPGCRDSLRHSTSMRNHQPVALSVLYCVYLK
jgi:hypothetical protein